MKEMTVKEARTVYNELIKEQKDLPGKFEEVNSKLQAKLNGENLPEGLSELRDTKENLTKRFKVLPDLVFDARSNLILALLAEKQATGLLMNEAREAAIDNLEAAFEKFSRAKDELENAIMSNKNILTFLEQLPSKGGQIVFDTILNRSFLNWGEPAGTPLSAKVKRQLSERMSEVANLFLAQKSTEIDILRATR